MGKLVAEKALLMLKILITAAGVFKQFCKYLLDVFSLLVLLAVVLLLPKHEELLLLLLLQISKPLAALLLQVGQLLVQG